MVKSCEEVNSMDDNKVIYGNGIVQQVIHDRFVISARPTNNLWKYCAVDLWEPKRGNLVHFKFIRDNEGNLLDSGWTWMTRVNKGEKQDDSS